tara:strand:+ start:133 stop:540 length:408 start_codon:yes stop_codon:yes gene_type:complete
MSKVKGSKAERELFHWLWKNFGPCIRSAGSGSTPKPCPDLIASNGKRALAIECKSTKGDKVYLKSQEIADLMDFSLSFGAEAWLGFRFDNRGWLFIEASKVEKSQGKSYYMSYSLLKKNGYVLDELAGKYRQRRL